MNFDDMTPEEIFELIQQLEKEMAARQNRNALETEINNVLIKARENGAAHQPKKQWDKTPYIDESFALGETTKINGVTYQSTIPNNMCDPRECRTGWKQKDDPDTDDDAS